MQKQVLNYKFRLYPSKLYQSRLESNLEACRFVYNYFIENNYDNEFDMNYTLVELKEQYQFLRNYHSKMLQMVSKQVANVKKALRELKKNGYKVDKPKIKSNGEYNSFVYNQSGFKLVNRDNKYYLWLSKIGYIRIKIHREVIGNIKQIIFKKRYNKWHVILTMERLYPIFKFINLKKIISIDLNSSNFIVDGNNDRVKKEEPKRLFRRLKLVQKRLSRRKKGSKNYEKAKRWYQVIHERIMNKRRDYMHKVSREYANKYDIIIAEDLRVRNMLEDKPLNTNKQNNTLHRNISNSSFRTFLNMLKYKVKHLILVNPMYTTQKCSKCDNIVNKSLNDRIHRCYRCGLIIDRDYNAALNILRLGLEYLPMEYGEVTPVEIISMKQEALDFSQE